MPLRLVIFDVDGTLIDSRRGIIAAMRSAFLATGRVSPSDAEILAIVGLSLPEAMAALVPGIAAAERDRLAHHYKETFVALRRAGGAEADAPLFPGAVAALDRLDGAGHLMSIATGKARRGLNHMLATHGLERRFLATQTADDAPSKPHPGMVLNCLAGTGVEAGDAVVIGDTEFDMGMARAAGARAIGVSWGCHERARLQRGGAEQIIDGFADLDAALARIWQPA